MNNIYDFSNDIRMLNDYCNKYSTATITYSLLLQLSQWKFSIAQLNLIPTLGVQ